MIHRIDRALLAEVSAEAKASPRLRKNRNFHPRDDYAGHRLLNAIEPASYVMPHRHLDPAKDETMVCLAGRLGLVFFAEDGAVTDVLVAAPGSDLLGVDIPHGVFHSVLALEPGTVFLEAKSGPYVPLLEAEKAAWAPTEGSAEAAAYCQKLAALF
jgi:cupin fold WbuC family metalloprotein